MASNRLNKFVDGIIKGEYDLEVEFGEGRGENEGESHGYLQVHGYPKSVARSKRGDRYLFGFTMSDKDRVMGMAVVRFAETAYYGTDVKNVMKGLIASRTISKQKANDLMCYLVMKFSDYSVELNKWIPE